MTKRELVERTLSGEAFDITPSCFSLHFPEEMKRGENAVKAHLDFFSDTDTDIQKIMNENLYPSNPGLFKPSDYERIKSYKKSEGFIKDQVELVKRVLDKADPDGYPICTIQGVIASLGHTMRPQYQALSDLRRMQVDFYREDKKSVEDAVKRITESLINLVEAVIDAGCKGIFYAVLGGERSLWTKEEFENIQAPFDKAVMKCAKDKGASVILHLCKKDLAIDRFESYGEFSDAVNWGIYENNISLEEGMKHFPGKVALGGLEHRSGIIMDGSLDDIKAEVHRLRKEMEGKPFILGADCTLATNVDRKRIKAAVDAARDII